MIKSFNGKSPKIADSAFVSETAYIVGDVEIGENSSVWPGTVIRGDHAKITIGKNTQIEDNCTVHTGFPMFIGDNVHIGHNVVVHCKCIGDTTLIGNHATLLDYAEIGEFCVVGAGALVPQGMNIPDRSFVVGVPAKVKGEVSDERIAITKQSVDIYCKMSKEYKEQGL
ncbi:MAG: gamma carbonic anhydrase family protein [Chloroflexota bacterium]|nr:gamma carbonic anhydrase family protein [Chloroflexota bacterium]